MEVSQNTHKYLLLYIPLSLLFLSTTLSLFRSSITSNKTYGQSILTTVTQSVLKRKKTFRKNMLKDNIYNNLLYTKQESLLIIDTICKRTTFLHRKNISYLYKRKYYPFTYFSISTNTYFNVSSTNSEQCKLCVNGPLYIDARLLWKQAIGSNCS